MEQILQTKLNGIIAITDRFHESHSLQKDHSLYKFIWVTNGSIDIEVDHVPYHLEKNEIVTLTPLHHLEFNSIEGEYIVFLFNSNFYCIYGHDDEVSCNGFLFYGATQVVKLQIDIHQAEMLQTVIDSLTEEMMFQDNLREEMVRILLKRFIILCTRIAREHMGYNSGSESEFDLIRQFYVLVDQHFKEKKKVQDYAEILYRSPKTLSNLFAQCNLPSPLRIIHERIEAEAKRLLLYTPMPAKEIGQILGFEDMPSFSRFFKKMTGKSISEYRKEDEKEKLPTQTE